MIRQLCSMVFCLVIATHSAAGFVVKGKAVQADGQTPATGIVVRATHMRESPTGARDAFSKTTKTAPDGAFRLQFAKFQ